MDKIRDLRPTTTLISLNGRILALSKPTLLSGSSLEAQAREYLLSEEISVDKTLRPT